MSSKLAGASCCICAGPRPTRPGKVARSPSRMDARDGVPSVIWPIGSLTPRSRRGRCFAASTGTDISPPTACPAMPSRPSSNGASRRRASILRPSLVTRSAPGLRPAPLWPGPHRGKSASRPAIRATPCWPATFETATCSPIMPPVRCCDGIEPWVMSQFEFPLPTRPGRLDLLRLTSDRDRSGRWRL